MQHSAKEVATCLPFFKACLKLMKMTGESYSNTLRHSFLQGRNGRLNYWRLSPKSIISDKNLEKKILLWRRPKCLSGHGFNGDHRIYNVIANEWDIFSEFSPATADAFIKTNYQALFADLGSPDYHMDNHDKIAAADRQDHTDGQASDGQDFLTHNDSWQPEIVTDFCMKFMSFTALLLRKCFLLDFARCNVSQAIPVVHWGNYGYSSTLHDYSLVRP